MPRSPRTPPNNDIPENYLPLEGSERFHNADTRRVGEAAPEEILQLILILRPRLDAPPLPDLEQWAKIPIRQRSASPRPDTVDDYGASPEDAEEVAAFARQNGLEVVSISLPRRMVEVSGTIAQINRTFGIKLGIFERPTETYRGHDGPVHLPRGVVDLIQAVFGLDNRRMAYRAGGSSVKISPLTPPDVAKLYGFPSVPPGIVDQTIGIFEFGGGYVTDASGDATDADAFFAGLKPPLPKPKMFTPPVSILGQTNSPGTSIHPSGADSEVVLDIDCAGSIAVGATLAVYFAPWTESGWIKAVTTAMSPVAGEPSPSVITISWGGPEEEWSAAQLKTLSGYFKTATMVKSVTVLACTMDDGTEGGIPDGSAHVYWPAIDPWVTAVGGTTIGDVSGSAFDEVTWNDNGVTGGGISTVTDLSGKLVFPLPSWQAGAGVPPSINDGKTRGRGIPDIAGYANGYTITLFGKNDGSWWGTSESTPFYAGLVAVLNATLGFNLGFLNPTLYEFGKTPGFDIFNDIDDDGSNAYTFTLKPPNPPTTITTPGYRAVKGWDACTGWGSIRGARLLAALASWPIVATAIASGGKFGDVCVSSFADLTLTINNTGFGLLAISDITSSSADFLVPDVSAYPLVVSVGGSVDVTIRFQPTSAGSKSATIKVFSNDPSSPHSVDVSGEAAVPRLSLAIADKGDFGTACIGGFEDNPLLLSNSGKCVLSVTGVSSSSAEFQVPEVLSYPLSVSPGNVLPLPIRFAPTSFGAKSSTLTVTSNDPAGPHTITVSGDAASGKIAVTGSTYVGGVKACCREQRTISICNVGDCKLNVSSVAFKHENRHWKLINNPFPATLHPGSCLSVVILYKATEKCPRACELVITSDDPANPVTIVEVRAYTIWCDCCKKCCDDCRKGACEKRHSDPCCCEKCHDDACDEENDDGRSGV